MSKRERKSKGESSCESMRERRENGGEREKVTYMYKQKILEYMYMYVYNVMLNVLPCKRVDIFTLFLIYGERRSSN